MMKGLRMKKELIDTKSQKELYGKNKVLNLLINYGEKVINGSYFFDAKCKGSGGYW